MLVEYSQGNPYKVDHLLEITNRLNKNFLLFLQMQELLDAQNRFVDSCQQVQQDDPKHVTDVLDKLIDSLIKLYVAHELFSSHTSPYLCKLR